MRFNSGRLRSGDFFSVFYQILRADHGESEMRKYDVLPEYGNVQDGSERDSGGT